MVLKKMIAFKRDGVCFKDISKGNLQKSLRL